MMIILLLILASATVAGLVAQLRRNLMMLQQNSYFNKRYLHWLRESGDTTSAVSICAMALFLCSLSRIANPLVMMFVMGAFGAFVAINRMMAKYKKPLVWTARARRIYLVASVLSIAIIAGAIFAFGGDTAAGRLYAASVASVGCLCGAHIILLAANWLLKPVERHINKGYINDAISRLRSMPDLKIVGITGSYGKTSTKHFLHRILSEQFDTLMTPGSYNTTLGVVRTVREYLKPYNEVFIVEMGAKQPGDIKEICDIVRPSIGIITAVGPQHLESFGNIETVQRTKFELADALPSDGLAFVNQDFEYIANRLVDNVRCERYSCTDANGADWKAVDIKYAPDGTSFIVEGPDEYRLDLRTRLLGEANISDLLVAVAVAHSMGVPDDKIRYAVGHIEPVEHRLSVKRTPGGITIVDDAYNSNPVGSRMAMEVLGAMSGGKRIVITPGMIELGEKQYELNADLGRHIGHNADVAIVVGQYNREALTEGIRSTMPEGFLLHCVDTFSEAQNLLSKFAASGDIVLYENDLPDTFK